jgi:hypothetical protein
LITAIGAGNVGVLASSSAIAPLAVGANIAVAASSSSSNASGFVLVMNFSLTFVVLFVLGFNF